MVSALIGCYLPNGVLSWLVRTRQREIFESFPDAADLMLVCVEAGLGLDAGLTKVAEEIKRKSVALAEELHLTNLELRAGASREQSLRNLAVRTGVEEVGCLRDHADAGRQVRHQHRRLTARVLGRPAAQAADPGRRTRRQSADKMLIPLVTCIFPSVIMVILGPAIIQIVRTIVPMLSGRG